MTCRTWLASTHGSDDLEPVSVLEMRISVLRLRRDLAVERDSRELALHLQVLEQAVPAPALGPVHRLTVHQYTHEFSTSELSTGARCELYPRVELGGERSRGGHGELADVAPADIGRGLAVHGPAVGKER